MSPPPARDPWAAVAERVLDDLKAAEREITALRLAVGALQTERGELLRRVGDLESWRRGEEVSRAGVAWGWGRALLTAIPAIVSLGIGIAVFVRGCD